MKAFAIGDKVILNSSHVDFDFYKDQADDTIGTVVSYRDDSIIKDGEWNCDVEATFIEVTWGNGTTNAYQIAALLPVDPNLKVSELKVGQAVLNKTTNMLGFKIGNSHVFSQIYYADGSIETNSDDELEKMDIDPFPVRMFKLNTGAKIYWAIGFNNKETNRTVITEKNQVILRLPLS